MSTVHRRIRHVVVACVLLLGGTVRALADVVSDWNLQVFTSGGAQIQRTLAMVHLAMFDALNATAPRYRAYLDLPAPPAGANGEAAAASAAHGVLVRLFPAQSAALDARLTASLAAIPASQARTDGVQYGDRVAQALVQARLDDHILAAGPIYVSTNEPGNYQLTTPGPPQPVNTGARSWVPFGLTSAAQFRAGPPPDLTSVRYARDMNETKAYGDINSAVRTGEQSETAKWFIEQSTFSLNRVARAEVLGDGRDLLAHARLFALLNVALADSITSVFDAKYTYLRWRPVTAIRNADLDGNVRTTADQNWSPFVTTPPHPEYPAAHGTVTMAMARVLSRYFGPHHGFDVTAPDVPGVTRHYGSFEAFASDAGEARIFGGMHVRTSIEVGQRQGKKVANYILGNYLQPLSADDDDDFGGDADAD
jgi:hypothetical protein